MLVRTHNPPLSLEQGDKDDLLPWDDDIVVKKSRQPKPYIPYKYREPDHSDWMDEARYQLNWLYDRKAAWEILLFVAADFPE